MMSRSLELSPEGSMDSMHNIPMEAVFLAEQGYTAYIYPCKVCLDRSREYREKNGYSLNYGSLIVFETPQWKKQWCTRPGCTNNVVEWFEEVDE